MLDVAAECIFPQFSSANLWCESTNSWELWSTIIYSTTTSLPACSAQYIRTSVGTLPAPYTGLPLSIFLAIDANSSATKKTSGVHRVDADEPGMRTSKLPERPNQQRFSLAIQIIFTRYNTLLCRGAEWRQVQDVQRCRTETKRQPHLWIHNSALVSLANFACLQNRVRGAKATGQGVLAYTYFCFADFLDWFCGGRWW